MGMGGRGRPLPSYVLRFIFGLMDNVFFYVLVLPTDSYELQFYS